VLVKAKKEGLIKALQPLLIELTQKNVWLSESLIGEILKEAGER
jgi:predicted nucleic acid-binding protein